MLVIKLLLGMGRIRHASFTVWLLLRNFNENKVFNFLIFESTNVLC